MIALASGLGNVGGLMGVAVAVAGVTHQTKQLEDRASTLMKCHIL